VIFTGALPQENVITPPFATAATKAADVQLSGVPVPTTVVGFDVSSAAASAGTLQWPSGFPAAGPSDGFVFGFPPLPAVAPLEVPAEPPPAPVELEPALLELHPSANVTASANVRDGSRDMVASFYRSSYST
jgi:hypothetical protein